MKYATIMLPQVQMLLVIIFFQNFSVFNFLVTGKRTWKRNLDFCCCCLIQTACLEYSEHCVLWTRYPSRAGRLNNGHNAKFYS